MDDKADRDDDTEDHEAAKPAVEVDEIDRLAELHQQLLQRGADELNALNAALEALDRETEARDKLVERFEAMEEPETDVDR